MIDEPQNSDSSFCQWTETDNPLWGLTKNPFAPNYSPGGSTGGEASLLAMKGSIIGWGTDLGGSIRGPSGVMGTYGLKPSVSIQVNKLQDRDTENLI